jgi:hypothetical protein
MSTSTTELERGPDTPASNGNRRAFITAPTDTDTGVIREILAREGVVAFTADELDLPGLSLPEIVREAVGRADMVVAVTGDADTNKNSNVFFELGFALAMKKRALLIVGGDAPLPMSAVTTGIPYLRADPTNAKAIQYGLSKFISAPLNGGKGSSVQAAETRPIGPAADRLLDQLRNEDGNGKDSALVQILVEAIRLSGVSTLSALVGQSRADFAVWSEDLEPWVPNPLLIEVRSKIRTAKDADELTGKLQRLADAARAMWVLLIYHDSNPKVVGRVNSGSVLALSAAEFLELLRSRSFGDVVRGLRNARAHGG